MNDPISDFLTRIRNACSAQQEQVFIPFSKMKAELSRILQEEGYIWGYEVEGLFKTDEEAAEYQSRINDTAVNKVILAASIGAMAGLTISDIQMPVPKGECQPLLNLPFPEVCISPITTVPS